MRKHLPIALAGAMALAGVSGTVAQAAPGAKGPKGGDARNLPGFVKKWEGEKQAAADLVARGKKTPDAKGVVKLDNGRYVQHGLETTEEMTIALIDFSDLEHNTMPSRTARRTTAPTGRRTSASSTRGTCCSRRAAARTAIRR